MGYKTKIQRIDRKDNKQYYIMCPVALAEALELQKGETVEWIIEDKGRIILKREMETGKERRKK